MPRTQEAGKSLRVRGQPGLYKEFQNSQGYIEKQFSKNKQTTTKAILVITQDKTHSQLFRDNIVVYKEKPHHIFVSWLQVSALKAGQMTEWSRAHTTLADKPTSVSDVHTMWLTTTSNSNSGDAL